MRRHFYFLLIFISSIAFNETIKYKLKLISSTTCESASNEKFDPTVAIFKTGIKKLNRHTQVVQSNITVLRLAGPISISMKFFKLKGSRKIEIFKIEKVDCQNPITYQLFRLITMKMTDDCKVMPGNYLTEEINPNEFSWILEKTVGISGRYEFVLLYYAEKGLAVCNSVVCDIQQLKSSIKY